METQSQNEIKPRVVRGRVELFVPYHDKEIAFAYPSSGPNTYSEVGKEILQKGLVLPHGDYTAALVHAAYCSDAKDESEFENIREIMHMRWLWIFNQNLWTDKGVYVVQDVQGQGRNGSLSVKNLEKILEGGEEIQNVRFSKDKAVRFASQETYVFGEHTAESFAKDGFVRASVNSEGAEKLAEVSQTFSYKPRTWGLTVAQGSIAKQSVSAWGCYIGGRLGLIGDSFGVVDGGLAFGVLQ